MSTPQTPLDNGRDFVLPGLASRPGGFRAWALATAFAYSSRWNRRRLEWHLYGLWSMILSDLVADLSPYALVVPQFGFDSMPKRLPKKAKAKVQSSDEDDELSSDEDEEQSSAEDASEQDEENVGGSWVDFEPVSASIADASFETVAVKDARQLTPDFSILLLRHSLKDGYITTMDTDPTLPMDLDDNCNTPLNQLQHLEDWDAIEIQGIKVPCILEVKPMRSRRLSSQARFNKLTQVIFEVAEYQLKEQSTMVFTTQATTDTLFLIAAVGEWWRWRIATRASFEEDRKAQNKNDTRNILPPSLTLRKPREKTNLYRSSPRRKKAVDYHETSDEDMQDADKVDYSAPRSQEEKTPTLQSIRYMSLHPMAEVQDRIEDVHTSSRANSVWSKYIRLGTDVSNQHFFLIHEAIRQELDSMLVAPMAN